MEIEIAQAINQINEKEEIRKNIDAQLKDAQDKLLTANQRAIKNKAQIEQ